MRTVPSVVLFAIAPFVTAAMNLRADDGRVDNQNLAAQDNIRDTVGHVSTRPVEDRAIAHA